MANRNWMLVSIVALIVSPVALAAGESSHLLRGGRRLEDLPREAALLANANTTNPNTSMISAEEAVANDIRLVELPNSTVVNTDFVTNVSQGQDVVNQSMNHTLSAAWGWHHGIFGETCCMCQVRTGWETLLYSVEDYHHWNGGHSAQWRCLHECPQKCGSNWHHGNYFGCFDESHLYEMDRRYGHTSGYRISYGHFGSIC